MRDNKKIPESFLGSNCIKTLVERFFEPAEKLAVRAMGDIIIQNSKMSSVAKFKYKNEAFHYNGEIYKKDSESNINYKIYNVPPLNINLIEEFNKNYQIALQIKKDKKTLYRDLALFQINYNDDGEHIYLFIPDEIQACYREEDAFPIPRENFNPDLISDKLMLKEVQRIINEYNLYKALI